MIGTPEKGKWKIFATFTYCLITFKENTLQIYLLISSLLESICLRHNSEYLSFILTFGKFSE